MMLAQIIGLKIGERAWLTVVEHGVPIWKECTVRGPLTRPNYTVRVEIDGRFVRAHQCRLMSSKYMLLHTN